MGAAYLIIWIVLMILVSVLMTLVVFAWNRKRKGKLLIIEKDFRNPYRKAQRYLLLYDKKLNGLRLYTNVFKPKSDKVIPTFERDPFLWDAKTIYAYQGVSGDPDDDNIVPLHKPIVSQAAALEQAREISNSLVNTMKFLDACKNYRLEQRAVYRMQRGKEMLEVQGIIRGIGYQGVRFEYQFRDEKSGTQETRMIIFDGLDLLRNLQPAMVAGPDGKERPDLVDIVPPPSYEDFITPEWVMNNYGVVPVEDVNVMLAKQKDAIASFNSSVNDRIMSHSSWITRNSTTIMIVMLIFVEVVSFSILLYEWSQAMAMAYAALHGASVTTKAVSILPNVTS